MTLSNTWFMEGYIDYELQKYRLLAYLQNVRKYFGQTKLYPQLGEIVAHYNNLNLFRTNKQRMQSAFPQRLASVDGEKAILIYEKIFSDNELMKELDDITEFAMEEMEDTIHEGRELYELIANKMLISPIGIVPLYKNEGYVLLHNGGANEIRIYSYNVALFEHKDASYRSVHMEYIDSRAKNIINTNEQIKRDIIREIRTLPNPAVYCVELALQVPLHETMLPIAKQLLARHVG